MTPDVLSLYHRDVTLVSDNDRGTTLKTVQRAIGVLDCVATSSEPPKVRRVAQALNLNLSTAYHLVNTLIEGRYLTKEPDGGLRIGPRIAVLYASLMRGTDLSRQLRPYIETLAADSGETAYLTTWNGGSVVIQAVAEGSQSLRVTGLQVGFSGSEDRRASGRAVLAYLPEIDVEAVADRLYVQVPAHLRRSRLANLESQLEEVRQSGYAVDNEEYEPGICCVSAPYFDATGKIAGSVTVSAPTVRAGALHRVALPRVLATAKRISDLLAGAVIATRTP